MCFFFFLLFNTFSLFWLLFLNFDFFYFLLYTFYFVLCTLYLVLFFSFSFLLFFLFPFHFSFLFPFDFSSLFFFFKKNFLFFDCFYFLCFFFFFNFFLLCLLCLLCLLGLLWYFCYLWYLWYFVTFVFQTFWFFFFSHVLLYLFFLFTFFYFLIFYNLCLLPFSVYFWSFFSFYFWRFFSFSFLWGGQILFTKSQWSIDHVHHRQLSLHKQPRKQRVGALMLSSSCLDGSNHTGGSRLTPAVHPCPLRRGGCVWLVTATQHPTKMSPNSDMVAELVGWTQFHSLSSLISRTRKERHGVSVSSGVAAATSIRVPGRRSAVQVVQVASKAVLIVWRWCSFPRKNISWRRSRLPTCSLECNIRSRWFRRWQQVQPRCGVVDKVVESLCLQRPIHTREQQPSGWSRRLTSSQMQSKEKVVDVPGVTQWQSQLKP